MSASFLITLREGLEAALVIGIILSYLHKTGQKQYNRQVYAGVLLAVVASILTAIIFESLLGGFEDHEQLFEGIFMLLAVCLLTPMILWMHRNSKNIKSIMETKINHSLSKRQLFGLVSISFLAVYREGVETVLFLGAAIFNSTRGQTLIGGFLGIAAAIILTVIIFKGTTKVNLRLFFKITGIILVFFAAGLTAHGVHEFQEVGILPVFIEHIWDTSKVINENGLLGSFLKILIGYDAAPSLLEFLSWFVYVVTVGRIFLRPTETTR
ncbi:MAG: FTR1 family iron permease [Bacillota bacterium]